MFKNMRITHLRVQPKAYKLIFIIFNMIKFNVPRGTRDFLPEDMVKRKYVEKVIQQVTKLFLELT